jgi:hypothetical protein
MIRKSYPFHPPQSIEQRLITGIQQPIRCPSTTQQLLGVAAEICQRSLQSIEQSWIDMGTMALMAVEFHAMSFALPQGFGFDGWESDPDKQK